MRRARRADYLGLPTYNLIADSKCLAQNGKRDNAIKGFKIAKDWNSSWPEDPKTYTEKVSSTSQDVFCKTGMHPSTSANPN